MSYVSISARWWENMIFTALFGILILGAVIYVSMKVIGNVLYGAVIVGLILLASYLIIGSIPDLKQVPLIGAYVPDLSWVGGQISTTGDVINVLKNVVYALRIIGVGRSSSGSLLITVANAGTTDLHGFRVMVDGQEARVLNSPKSPLRSGESTVIEAGWAKPFSKVTVWSLESSADYMLS
jgi:hypothetical protein